MLCSKCYKKIPEGEEVRKSSTFYWRASWGHGGMGSEIFCKKCAKETDRLNRKLFLIFISLFLFVSFVMAFVSLMYYLRG